MKKTAALILALIILLSAAIPAFADDASESIYNLTETEVYADSETPEPSEGDQSGTDGVVAILYMCSSGPHNHYVFGHVWICIKNVSNESIMVGGTTIAPGEMTSFGLHHFDGLHYDMEMTHFGGEEVKAIEYPMTFEDLSKADQEICRSKWGWYELFAHNCTNFSVNVWKAVTGQSFFAFCFPFVVRIQMAKNDVIRLMISKY